MVERLDWDKYDGMNASPEGEFVTYADYDSLAARLAEAEQQIACWKAWASSNGLTYADIRTPDSAEVSNVRTWDHALTREEVQAEFDGTDPTVAGSPNE